MVRPDPLDYATPSPQPALVRSLVWALSPYAAFAAIGWWLSRHANAPLATTVVVALPFCVLLATVAVATRRRAQRP